VWRNALGSTADLRANGDNTGASRAIIDSADYLAWRANFGAVEDGIGAAAIVPESTSLCLMVLTTALAVGMWRSVR
jgi:hypothetical protein